MFGRDLQYPAVGVFRLVQPALFMQAHRVLKNQIERHKMRPPALRKIDLYSMRVYE